jgi:uncharacterized damage-inducible protein DinB
VTEAWLQGPVAGVPSVLMPAAHSFLQVRQELPELLNGLAVDQLWRTVGTSTSIGFHAVHLAGATDRLLTYARGEQLSDEQLLTARSERSACGLTADELGHTVIIAMDRALEQLRSTPSDIINEVREVGRQRLPSTVLGLLFHAAEHATRHAGQIATLRKVLDEKVTS